MSLSDRLSRAYSMTFERLSARPLSIVVFAASVFLLVSLQSTQFGHFRARGVAIAHSVEHPALLATFVEEVYVQSGDRVQPGAPLASLSPYFLERELSQLNLEVEQLLHEAELARAELFADEERWLAAASRQAFDQLLAFSAA